MGEDQDAADSQPSLFHAPVMSISGVRLNEDHHGVGGPPFRLASCALNCANDPTIQRRAFHLEIRPFSQGQNETQKAKCGSLCLGGLGVK